MSINVLSLFDGISAAQVALDRLNIDYNYYASEINKFSIQVTMDNYPNTIQLGDIKGINGNTLPNIHLLIGGSPCKNLSIACKANKRTGLAGEHSILFFEYLRVLKEVKPKYFLFENVASMDKKDRAIITYSLGVEPININSELIAPALRNRLYWTNIPKVELPKRKDITLNSILTSGWSNREKARCILNRVSNRNKLKLFHRYYSTGFNNIVFENEAHYNECVKHYNTYFKGLNAYGIDELMNNIDIKIYEGLRRLNTTEKELCQTFPIGYTKNVKWRKAHELLGDSFTVDVIKHILSYML